MTVLDLHFLVEGSQQAMVDLRFSGQHRLSCYLTEPRVCKDAKYWGGRGGANKSEAEGILLSGLSVTRAHLQ